MILRSLLYFLAVSLLELAECKAQDWVDGDDSFNVHVDRIFQFGEVGRTIENLAVRSNGNIIFSLTSPRAEVWEMDPRIGNSSGHIVADNSALSGHVSALGISEVGKDVFAVVSGDPTVADTFTISTIDFKHAGKSQPQVKTVASLPDAVLLNGLTTLDGARGTVLVSDSFLGVVYRVNVNTGDSAVVLQDASLAPPNTSTIALGVNGIRKSGNHLYYINSGKRTYNRVLVSDNGTAAGPYEVLADLGDLDSLPDDFAVAADGTAFIAGSNQVIVAHGEGQARVLAGGPNQTVVVGSTSAQVGRGRRGGQALYVSTNGIDSTVNPSIIEPGFVAKLTVG